jgi:hypothetical protein
VNTEGAEGYGSLSRMTVRVDRALDRSFMSLQVSSVFVEFGQKPCVGADRLQLVFPKTLKFVLTQAPFPDQPPKHISQNRVSIVVGAIDPLAALVR